MEGSRREATSKTPVFRGFTREHNIRVRYPCARQRHRRSISVARRPVWSSGILVGDNLDIGALLVVGEHDGDAVNEREMLQVDGKSLAGLSGPDHTDAGPDFLSALLFAGGLAVEEHVCRVRHKYTLMINDI